MASAGRTATAPPGRLQPGGAIPARLDAVGTVLLFNLLRFLLLAFELLVIARVLLSYVETDPRRRSALGQLLVAITEPVLAPIRNLLPKGGMFDFSPLVVILVLGVIIRSLPG